MREIKFRAWVPNAGVEGHFMTDTLNPFKDDVRWLADYPIMQYTGLKDKNGKEIYEGDIVKWPNSAYGEIFYKTEQMQFSIRNGWAPPLFGTQGGIEIAEIIGNIYENPELLKD